MPLHLPSTRRAGLVAVCALALATAACSSSPSTPPTTAAVSPPTTAASATTATTTGPTASTAAPASAQGAAVAGIVPIPAAELSPAGSFGTRPKVTVPSGNPPSALEAWDLIVGTGATASAGDTVTVQYDGYSWTKKSEFDASWNRGQPFSFTLGEGQVIKGWDQGVAGMKVGGRRELIIPPSLGYDDQPPTSAIADNDTLIFVVDLVSIGPTSG
jgi:peptidylprolyl isomerase